MPGHVRIQDSTCTSPPPVPLRPICVMGPATWTSCAMRPSETQDGLSSIHSDHSAALSSKHLTTGCDHCTHTTKSDRRRACADVRGRSRKSQRHLLAALQAIVMCGRSNELPGPQAGTSHEHRCRPLGRDLDAKIVDATDDTEPALLAPVRACAWERGRKATQGYARLRKATARLPTYHHWCGYCCFSYA